MWNRLSVKTYAKDFLRKHYWKAFIVCLIVTIITGNHTKSRNNDPNDNYYDNPNTTIEEFIGEKNVIPIETNYDGLNLVLRRLGLLPLAYMGWGFFLILIAFSIFISMTIGSLLAVGKNRFFLRGFKGDVSITYLFSTFRKGEFWGIFKCMFITGFYNFLWSLLLIIPGIIKYYEYRFVSYILTDEPNIRAKEAIERSMWMTNGEKWNMFVLDLSFIGWYLLGLFFFGIGGIFVHPYHEASFAKLYNVLSGNDNLPEII